MSGPFRHLLDIADLGSLLLVHFFRASRWRFLIAPVQHVPMRDVVLLKYVGLNPVVVHGGGPQIEQMLKPVEGQ